MRALLIKTALFILVLIVLLSIISNVLIKGITAYQEGQVGKVNQVLKHTIDTDIAVFGSSVAWVHFNPKIVTDITGQYCFNFGLDGTPLVQYKGLLEEFASYSKSNTIVIAGAFDEFAPREQLHEIYKFSSYIDNDHIYKAFTNIDSDLSWKLRYVPFYRFTTYDKYFYSHSFAGLANEKSKLDKESFRGFSPSLSTWPENSVNVKDTTKIILPINDYNIKAYRETIKYLNSKGKKVVLVLTPIYTEGQMKFRNLDAVREAYISLAGEENIFLDFTKSEICSDKKYFYNNSHLNATGADIFSKEFSEKLLKLKY